MQITDSLMHLVDIRCFTEKGFENKSITQYNQQKMETKLFCHKCELIKNILTFNGKDVICTFLTLNPEINLTIN